MTDQHRATPNQWFLVEDDDNQITSCILELRARVEALEAAQQPTVRTFYGTDATIPRYTATGMTTPPLPSQVPVDSLVGRVLIAGGMGLTDSARAAIREVAAWINERDLLIQNEPDCLEAPFADDAVRWLRDEASR